MEKKDWFILNFSEPGLDDPNVCLTNKTVVFPKVSVSLMVHQAGVSI